MNLFSQCLTCSHFQSPLDHPEVTGHACDAFAKIPDEIWGDVVDHRKPYPGDHGIQWDALPGESYPEAALKAGQKLAKQ